jgi:hypothetical protein
MSAYTSKTSSPRTDYTPTVTGSYCYDPVSMAAAAAAAATSVNASTPTLLYTPSSKADSDMSTSPSTDSAFKRSPNNYLTSSPSPPKRPFFGQNGLFDSGDSYEEALSQRHMRLSTDSSINNAKYQIQTSTNNTNQLPYSYRRPSEYGHYSTYTESQPSYYNTLISSYHHTNNNNNNNATSNNHNSSNLPYVPLKIENQDSAISSQQQHIKPLNAAKSRSSILSHHNSSDSQL